MAVLPFRKNFARHIKNTTGTTHHDFDEETYGVEIHSENGKYKLAGENPEEFPALPVLEDPFTMDVPSDSLIRGIQHTLCSKQ